MIRKPDALEFRESRAVTAVRDVRTLAIEGGRGVGQGLGKLALLWFGLMLGFGFVMTMAVNAGATGRLLLIAGAVAWFIHARQQRARHRAMPAASLRDRAPRRTSAAVAVEERYEVSVAAVGQRAAKMAVPAIIFFPTAGTFTFMAPLTLFGVSLLAVAIVTVARLRGDRTVLRYDGRTLTVRGLLGEATMRWEDVDDVAVRKFSLLNLPVLFTSGSRRNIEVTARINRLGGPERLLIPYPLLGVSQEGLVDLVSALLTMQAGSPDEAPATLDRPASVRKPARASATPHVAEMPFDPDAIMARYMAEREQVVAAAGPEPVPMNRPAFGRKVVRN